MEDIGEAEDAEAAAVAVMAAGEEDTEVEVADMGAVAAEVMIGPVEIPTETADQPRFKKARKLMLQ